MAARAASAALRDTSIARYTAKRNFTRTLEPAAARVAARPGTAPLFVVQRHQARTLHWDFRLEHAGVLLSWAVPKGPSLDPADKRLAVHVEDHPLDYAGFAGTIPKGEYGGGTVEIWDRGTWTCEGDVAAGMKAGELKFALAGQRLRGRFALVRMKPKPGDRAENWLLFKERDGLEQAGVNAGVLEHAPTGVSKPRPKPPAPGAKCAALPERQEPQLATTTDAPPSAGGWLSELKFDGYRLLATRQGGTVTLRTRSGLDWTSRLPSVARAIAKLPVTDARIDGELVALDDRGLSSFPLLQAALNGGGDRSLFLYAFDLLHLDGWDLRSCRLLDRKVALAKLVPGGGLLRYSDHVVGQAERTRKQGCALGLEGTVCKRADSPYEAGRSRSWLKLKCHGREEFVVLGWTPPKGRRTGIGALHVGYYDAAGRLHYAGGLGTGFTAPELARLRGVLDPLKLVSPPKLLVAGDRPDGLVTWVKSELVAEAQFTGWSGAGRLRHGVYLGLREDKPAAEVVRAVPDEDAAREELAPRARSGAIVVARAPGRGAATVGGVELSHAGRELWPGVTKGDLARYWQEVSEWALPGIAHRPLAILRCPEGIAGESFFQKHGNKGLPPSIREGQAGSQPYLAIDDAAGLVAMAQLSAIELHSWGASLSDPLHPDRLVFDLDPGDGVGMPDIARAAHDVRDRLGKLGLASFCRTSGGKGLHVVAPLQPGADWDAARAFARAFAERMASDSPDRYVAVVKKSVRRGRILVDWLRNGLGATAVASYVPRARPGAGVAIPLAWRDVTAKLDPAAYTIHSVPGRLARLRRDPWAGFASIDQRLPKGTP